jgi:hypothetical protein
MDSGDLSLTPAQQELVERFARFIVSRNLSSPALLFLESVRPLTVIGSQALHFLNPLASIFLDSAGIESLANFLQRRESVDLLIQNIEDMETKKSNASEDNSKPEDASTAS